MNIEPLDMIHGDAIKTAWRLSRDVTQDTSLHEIIMNDVPVLEMAVGTFLFQDFTIIEREIFTSARNHVMWARTSRVDDPRLFSVPKEFTSDNSVAQWFEVLRKQMIYDADEGIAQDVWRMRLPLLAQTTWVARHSYRDLLRLAGYFGYLTDHDAINAKLRTRFAMVELLLIDMANCLIGTSVAPPRVGFDKLLHEGPIADTAMSTTVAENWRTIHTSVPIGLRAQIVRHREIQFADTLFDHMCHKLEYRTLGDEVDIDMIATNDHWAKIISKRACWIAQSDLWRPILEEFDTPPLPCDATGTCPYMSDNMLRHEGKDPNPPCPIWQRLDHGGILTTNLHQAAQMHHAAGRPSEAFWLEQIT